MNASKTLAAALFVLAANGAFAGHSPQADMNNVHPDRLGGIGGVNTAHQSERRATLQLAKGGVESSSVDSVGGIGGRNTARAELRIAANGAGGAAPALTDTLGGVGGAETAHGAVSEDA